jgi:hypothetical protein
LVVAVAVAVRRLVITLLVVAALAGIFKSRLLRLELQQ